MFDFKNIREIQKKVEHRDVERKNKSESVYNEAINLIETFHRNPARGLAVIKEAAQKLSEVVKNDHNNFPALFCLAYIFYIMEEDKLAVKYIRMAEALSPEAGEVRKLKDLISRAPVDTTAKKVRPVSTVTGNKTEEISMSVGSTRDSPRKISSVRRLS